MAKVFYAVVFVLLGSISAFSQDRAFIQIAARSTLDQALQDLRRYSNELEGIGGFRLRNGWYALAVGPYDLAVQIAQDGETTYRLTGLAANVGSSDISGSATVALDGPRPKLSGSFTSENLGLADFTPDGEGQQKTEQPRMAGNVSSSPRRHCRSMRSTWSMSRPNSA